MSYRRFLFFLALLTIALGITTLTERQAMDAQTVLPTFDSPLPTPVTPLSETTQIALRYVADRYQLPIADLLVVNEHERRYPLTNRTFEAVTIWIKDRPDSPEFKLLVDTESGRVEEDIDAIEVAEQEAYRAKYGKLHPTLYERLQTVTDTEKLPVAVWAAPNLNTRTQKQVFDELVRKYPQAGPALAERGVPWAVANTVLAEEIRQTY